MKIEVWSDLYCPWCGLGHHRLEQALRQFEHREAVEVTHHSFQLDPGMPAEPASSRALLKRKYGMGDAQAEAVTRRVEVLAERDGLTPYHVLENEVANTGLAHEFLAYATESGKHQQAWDRMFRAYFGERRSIFTIEALAELGAELGLEPAATRRALTEHRFRDRVEQDARRAATLGVRGVPFFLIDGRYAVSGAQEIGLLLGALRQAWSETDSVTRPA